MKIEIITMFPEFFDSVFSQSILKRAQEAEKVEITIHDLKAYSEGPYHQLDDYRFGGGAGMLLKPEPFFRAFNKIFEGTDIRPLVLFPTPQGVPFEQSTANELAVENHLVFLCGHYKGIDQRVIDRWVDREYSIGDYVVSGGEVASTVISDAVIRLIPGVLGNLDSARTDSFSSGMLDGPHYTRPENYKDFRVPAVLINGHHKNIQRWRKMTSTVLTKRRRMDLISN